MCGGEEVGAEAGEVGAAEAGEGKGAAEDGERAASGKMSWAAEDKGKYKQTV